MEKSLAGHISLHLGLINTIHTCPDKSCADDNGPECVPPQRAGIKAETQYMQYNMHCTLLTVSEIKIE